MVKRCQWGLCNTDSRYPERIEGVRFIPFPKPKKNLEKCKRWIKACGRPHEQLNVEMIDGNYHMFVCSKVSIKIQKQKTQNFRSGMKAPAKLGPV